MIPNDKSDWREIDAANTSIVNGKLAQNDMDQRMSDEAVEYQNGKNDGYKDGYRDAVKAKPSEWLADHDRKLLLEYHKWLHEQDNLGEVVVMGPLSIERFLAKQE